jgi:plasmid stability protein
MRALHTMTRMEARSHAETTTLTVRKVDRQIKEKLRVRAARHGHSMEAELRLILQETLSEAPVRELNLAEAIRRRVAPLGGIELEPHPRVTIQEATRFEE